MFMILYFNMTLSLMVLFMTHPLSMGIVLFIQTLLISILTGMLINNFWFSYIMFLVFIGGLLILFMYMTSIASNEILKFSTTYLLPILLLIITGLFMKFFTDNFYSLKFYINLNNNEFMIKFFNTPNNKIMFLLITYLLITLIATVKITNIKYGPIRQKF
uniref:NADH-ubiquinone oxidoreductase chain 6 n=1 Tax=Pselaphinae sp. 6 EF-2015 TaxID=1756860 RepID=A0A0S2M8X3_9COLE|nr:NADH deshydrogenase subunit 6 [Pselaphinae sp. 6 EF-2015]